MIPTVLLLLVHQAPDTKTLDDLAQKRDVDGLTAVVSPASIAPFNPLKVLKTNGAYDTGRYGWHAVDLTPPDGGKTYVVLTTPLTTEDVGDMVFLRTGDRLEYVPEDNPLGIRPVRHKFDIAFDIPTKTVRITDDLKLKKAGTPGPHFFIRMSPYLKVASITESGKAVPFVQAGGVTAITTFSGQTAEIEIKYSGICNLPQYAGSIVDNEAQLTNDLWYPMIARYPAPYDLTVHSPKGWMAVGQGEQTSMKEDASGRTTQYRMDMPVVWYSLSIGPYRVQSQMDGKRKISAWSMVRTDEQLKLQTELYKPILRFYDQTFSPFPFSGYGALVTRLYGGGALEAYSFATYGGGIPDEDAHEPSHTWWGGMINNTYLHSLWNESFADFCEGLYARNVPIGNRAERTDAFVSNASPQQSYLSATCEAASPWIGGPSSSLGYGKGAKVLQMFENEVGTPTMIKTMRQWLQDQPKGEPGEWKDYERAVRKATGKDYKWFFDEWIRRPGWAQFEVKDVVWKNNRLTGKVYFLGEPYRIDCEVLLRFKTGPDVLIKFNTIQSKEGDHFAFSLPVATQPDLVSVDPWHRLLRGYRPDEEPVMLDTVLQRARRYSDPKHTDYLSGLGGDSLDALPVDLDNTFLVGSPETLPAVAPLCKKAGFVVKGNKLTYQGTTIDLTEGGAMAVVDLPHGKRCVIGMGTFRMSPNYGRARTVLFDKYGRFLRGKTDPKTSGWMTFRLGAHPPATGGGIS